MRFLVLFFEFGMPYYSRRSVIKVYIDFIILLPETEMCLYVLPCQPHKQTS